MGNRTSSIHPSPTTYSLSHPLPLCLPSTSIPFIIQSNSNIVNTTTTTTTVAVATSTTATDTATDTAAATATATAIATAHVRFYNNNKKARTVTKQHIYSTDGNRVMNIKHFFVL